VYAPDYFIDEQRFGPYKFWQHQHLLKAVSTGTQVRDIIHYAIGFKILGRLVQRLIVSPRLDDIFDYRHEKLKQMFHDSPVR